MKKINLSIPQPCHEDWNKMTQEAKGKFCGSCKKTVIDFTNMSDRQLAEFFKKPASSVCGRFQQEQLDRDILVPRKRIPWIKYFFQFALPAFLISVKANAQKGKIAVKKEPVNCTQTLGIVSMPELVDTSHSIKEIQGKVMDEKGEVIPFATVIIKGGSISTVCDSKGVFKILPKDKKENILVVNAEGFQSKEFKVANSGTINIVLNKAYLDLGEVIVTTGKIACSSVKKIKAKSIPAIKNK